MTLIAIIAINTLLWLFPEGEVAFSGQENAGMGHTPRVSCWRRIPAAWSPRSVNDMDLWFLGSAHSVPTDVLCLRCIFMACRESNSLLQWAHLKPNAVGNLFGPSGFPLPEPLQVPAPWRMLWLDFNLLQTWISASAPNDANCSETGTKNNTQRRIRTPRILCKATDWSVAWMCTHHGLFHNLNEKQPKCQNDKLKINESNAIKTIQCNAAHCTPTQNVMRAHAQSITFIMRIEQLPKTYWVNLRAGRSDVSCNIQACRRGARRSRRSFSGLDYGAYCKQIINSTFDFYAPMQGLKTQCIKSCKQFEKHLLTSSSAPQANEVLQWLHSVFSICFVKVCLPVVKKCRVPATEFRSAKNFAA